MRIWEPKPPPVKLEAMPRHAGIIMDGNGRWALRQGYQRTDGHRAGAESVRDVVQYGGQIGLPALTLYAFSTENWSRPHREVHFLMGLIKEYLEKELDELKANGVRLSYIGRIHELPSEVHERLEKAQTATVDNPGLRLCLALNYGSRNEWVDAARVLAQKAVEGRIKPEEIDLAMVASHLQTAHLPPLDLLIRTAGERRLSNFLLWQACHAFFWVSDRCWPEFRGKDLEGAIREFARSAESTPWPCSTNGS